MKTKILSAILLIVTLILSIPVSTFAAENSRIDYAISEFLDPSGAIIAVSSKGEWDIFPENSIPAIEEAAKTDVDFVLIDIKKTADDELIVFSDETTERMLFCDSVLSVSEVNFSELLKYHLKNSCGGSAETESEYFIPTLKEALDCAKEIDIPLILRAKAELLPAISELLNKENAHSMCIVSVTGTKKELRAAVEETENLPYIIGTKKGNVVFDVISFVNTLDELGGAGVELKTVNAYGINYYKSLVGSFSEKMRIIADPTIPEECGSRQDSIKWWDDLISRGYSVIITDHADIISEYKKENSLSRERLQEVFDKYVTNHKLPDFKDEVLNDLKKAYTDAVSAAEEVLQDSTASNQQLNDCYTALVKAANDISKNYSALEDGSAGTTVTVPRILLCVAAVIVVVAVQIYFFKRRKKVG